jgi:tetratricopeptide (TPR) repeat protein
MVSDSDTRNNHIKANICSDPKKCPPSFFVFISVLIIIVALLLNNHISETYKTYTIKQDIPFIPQSDRGRLAESSEYKGYLKLKSPKNLKENNPNYYAELRDLAADIGSYSETTEYAVKLLNSTCGDSYTFCETHNHLGTVNLDIGKINNAGEELKIADKAYPGRHGMHEPKAGIYCKLGEYDQGEKHFMGEFVNATCTDSIAGVGHINLIRGSRNDALIAYRIGRIFDIGDSFCRSGEAVLQTIQGNYQAAEQLMQEAMSLQPYWGRDYIYLADIEKARRNYDKAFQNHILSLEIDPRSRAIAYCSLGNLLLDVDDINKRNLVINISLKTALIMFLILTFTLFFRWINSKTERSPKVPLYGSALILILTGFILFGGISDFNKFNTAHATLCSKAVSSYGYAVDYNSNYGDYFLGLSEALRRVGDDAGSREALAKAKSLPIVKEQFKLFYPY